jgi:hypothetical protein
MGVLFSNLSRDQFQIVESDVLRPLGLYRTRRLFAWIDPGKLNFSGLSANPCPDAIKILRAHPEQIDWVALSGNPCPDAVVLLRENPENIDWDWISCNPCPDALALLRENPEKIHKIALSQNHCPDAIPLLIETSNIKLNAARINQLAIVMSAFPTYSSTLWILRESPENINWDWISEHPHPEAIKLLRESPENINRWELSRNPCAEAVAILREDPRSIAWRILSENYCPDAIALLRENLEKIDWTRLSRNTCPDAVALLRETPNKIDWPALAMNWCPDALTLFSTATATTENVNWEELSKNPGIFEEVYDYEAMRAAMDIHREGLAKAAFHPRRLARYLEAGDNPEDF